MRLNRFYTPRENIRIGSSVKLEQDDANHIRKTLRLDKGDQIIVFNGEKEFLAQITISSSEFAMVELVELLRQKDFSKESHTDITIFQGIIKANYFETMLEKCTELGVTGFVPFETEFGQIRKDRIEKKYERWNRIIKSACKQSERIDVAELYKAVTFKDVIETLSSDKYDAIIVLAIQDRKESNEVDSTIHTNLDIQDSSSIALVIGAEGGLSPREYEQLSQIQKVQFVQINNNVLRSETAAIAASSIISFQLLKQ